MDVFATIVGHLAWPVTALVLGFVLLRELKLGLFQKVLGGIRSLKVGGVEVLVNEAREAAEEADIPVGEDAADGTEVADSEAYRGVMKAWSQLAGVVTGAAAKLGGEDDQRMVKQNLDLLLNAKVIDSRLYEASRSLQRARNAIRRTRAAGLSDEAAREFTSTAHSVSEALRAKVAGRHTSAIESSISPSA